MNPVRIEQGIPIFSSSQVDQYGFPEWYGYEVYQIVETRDCIPMVTDFKMESHYYKRPIHRYCRRKRFQNVLAQLLNDKGKVPFTVVEMVREEMFPNRELWDEIRTVLKKHKLRIYYNRIPYIIQQLKKISSTSPVHIDQYQAIMKDFDKFCFLFDQQKHEINRSYFPNMRFIALKLIERYGIVFNYEIPFTRTLRKRKDLEQIWLWFIMQ